MNGIKIFFRNDDVNCLDPTLIKLTQVILKEGAAVDLAIEPANVLPEAVTWLKEQKQQHPNQISLITHGYNHQERIPGKGEFGGRAYEDQLRDIQSGKELMKTYFGDLFFPAFTCPRGGHNKATLRCMNDTGYLVFSSYHNVYLKNKLLYRLGRALNQTHLMGKRISYHPGRIPGTNLMDISMSMSLIGTYVSDKVCVFNQLDYLKDRYNKIKRTGQRIIGVTLHHRYHTSSESWDLLQDTIRFMKSDGCRFVTLETLFWELTGR